MLYVSGHGVLSQNRRFYLATTTTALELLRSTAIEDSFVNDVMQQSRARSIVLVLDCCHSGAFGKGLVPKSALVGRRRASLRGPRQDHADRVDRARVRVRGGRPCDRHQRPPRRRTGVAVHAQRGRRAAYRRGGRRRGRPDLGRRPLRLRLPAGPRTLAEPDPRHGRRRARPDRARAQPAAPGAAAGAHRRPPTATWPGSARAPSSELGGCSPARLRSAGRRGARGARAARAWMTAAGSLRPRWPRSGARCLRRRCRRPSPNRSRSRSPNRSRSRNRSRRRPSRRCQSRRPSRRRPSRSRTVAAGRSSPASPPARPSSWSPRCSCSAARIPHRRRHRRRWRRTTSTVTTAKTSCSASRTPRRRAATCVREW